MAAIETQPASAGTGLVPYTAPQAEEYRARIVMTPDDAKALDEQVRACTRAVLREGTDYGIIPGTNGDKTLWRPGAQKLLQWFGYSASCERVEVERDDDGRKHGITYRATVTRRLPDGSPDTLATCEGTADYDESKFYQSEEQVRARLRDQEHKWAAKDRRVPNADRWMSAKEYRADWNALMKRAQKRAIVGAVVDATAAGGIFSDREEDDNRTAPPDDGPSLADRLLDEAASFTTEAAGQQIWRDAAAGVREGLCTPGQATHVQNRVRVRLKSLQQAAQPVHVGDLARQAAQNASSAEHMPPVPPAGEARSSGPAPSGQPAGNEPAAGPDDTDHDSPGTVTRPQLTKLGATFTDLGFTSKEREQRLVTASRIIGRDVESSSDLSLNEASKLIDTLDGLDGSREKLIALLAAGEVTGDE